MDQSRYADSYNTRRGGGSNKSILDLSKVPSGKEVSFFKPVEGANRIDIVSYPITTKNHPGVHARKYKLGAMDYRLDVWLHRNVGPAEATVMCIKNTYGKACPICEMAEEARREGRKDEYSALKAKRVVFYNVVDLNEPEKGIQIFQSAHSLFEGELIEEAKNSTDDGSFVDFADEKEGYSVSFRGSKAKAGTYEFLEFKGFKFIKRNKSIEDLVADTFPLDALLNVPTTEKVSKILNGVDDDEDDPTDFNPEQYETPEPPKKPENPCPHDHVFGDDCDKFPECDGCKNWKACYKASM